jgi:hypothetical protein
MSLRVLSAGVMRRLVGEVGDAFHRETGHAVLMTAGTVGELTARAEAGEPADVFVLTDTAVDALARQGLVVPGSRVDLARTAVGVGVRRGALLPDISTPEAFRDACSVWLRSSTSIRRTAGRAGSTSPACSGSWESTTRSAGRRCSGPGDRPPRRLSAARPNWSCTRSARSWPSLA